LLDLVIEIGYVMERKSLRRWYSKCFFGR
jgi:hypothetical protein